MKNIILNKFALNDLRIHKKDALTTIIIIFIASLIVMMTSLLTPLFVNKDYVAYQSENGTYTYSAAYYNEDTDVSHLIKSDYIVEGETLTLNELNHCWVYNYGYTLNNETMVAIDGDNAIVSTYLKEGRMPNDNYEVAMKRSVLDNWGYDVSLNDDIHLSYLSYDHQKSDAENLDYNFYIPVENVDIKQLELDKNVKIKCFKVVGVLEESGTHDVIVSTKIKENHHLYIRTDMNQNGYIKTIDNALELHLEKNKTADDFTSEIEMNITLVLIQLFIIVIAVSLIYGLTLSSFEKKQKDLTLFRSIGVTQRQLYYVIFIQSLILSVGPIILSMIIVFLISFFIPLIIEYNLVIRYDLLNVIWNAFVIFFVVYMSYFIPARSITNKALTLTFDTQEFQKIYYQYKKPHTLRAIYLAWRQLMNLKKKMLIKVFLIAIISVYTMNISKMYLIQFYNSSFNDVSMTYEYIIDEEQGENIVIQNIKDFVHHAFYADFIYSDDIVKDNYNENDIVHRTSLFIYCTNEDIKNYYQLTDLNPGEIIVSDAFINYSNENYKLHDKMTLLGQEYEIIQIINHGRDEIFVSEDVFDRIDSNQLSKNYFVQYSDIHQRTKAFLQCKDIMHLQSIDRYALLDNNKIIDEDITKKVIQYLLLIASISVIYIYHYSFEIMKQKEDIGTYQLLGMTNKEISSIYFYKSFIIGLIGIVIGGFYYLLVLYDQYAVYLDMQYILKIESLMIILLSAVLSIIMISVISLYPLRSILKNDAFENKNTRE